MSYAFDRADPDLSASLRRIVKEELGAALSQLDRLDEAEAVHGIRKNLKKTRALLRLVHKGLDAQPGLNCALRQAGLALSARRDAQVRLATLDRLFPTTPDVLQPLREALAHADRTATGDPPATIRDTLADIRRSAKGWNLRGKDDRVLREGLTLTREKARRAARAARDNPGDVERIHQWRKRAKDHWYQARLFAPSWPELFKPVIESADRLGEMLGNHHDLSVLAIHVAGLPDALVSDPGRELLGARLRDAQTRIEAEAFPLGGRLFAGDPGAVSALWLDWRRDWLAQA
jgi:CHAD domain-containing protein